jgi:hypothetical protein
MIAASEAREAASETRSAEEARRSVDDRAHQVLSARRASLPKGNGMDPETQQFCALASVLLRLSTRSEPHRRPPLLVSIHTRLP